MRSRLVFAVCLGLAAPVEAQTSSQINQIASQLTQLVQYTGKISARLIIAEQELAAEKSKTATLILYLKEFTCKHNRLAGTVQIVSKATDAAPVQVELISGKNCAGDGPAMELPK